MAQLPELQPDALQGTGASTAAVQPTDFGLDRIGGELRQTDALQQRAAIYATRVQAKADQAAVAPDVQTLQTTLSQQFAGDAPNWNGTPGFASDQIAKANKAATDMAANPAYTPGQKSEFQQAANHQIAAYGDQVNNHERQVLVQNAVDAQDVVANGALTNFLTNFSPAEQALHDDYDGSQTGLTTATLQAFDQSASAAVASLPPQLQPRMEAKFSAMRVEQQAKTEAIEHAGATAFVVKNGRDQAYSLINTISSNPSAYDSVVSNGLPAIVATLPPGLAGIKKDLTTELTGMAATARVKGLIQLNEAPQAQTELNEGRYDGVLTPTAKDGLLAEAGAAVRDRAPRSIDQALQQQDIERRAQAETYARLSTGKSTGQISIADLKQLPIDRAATILTNWQQASQTFAAAGSVRDMATPQVAALASAAAPDPADPDYQNKLTMWETQRQAAQGELKLRQEPGAWAFASSGKTPMKGAGAAGASVPQDRGAALQALWQGVQTATGADQIHAGAQYAGTMLGSQYGAGIPAAARQIVPHSEAARLALGVIQAPPEAKGAALQAVASVVGALPSTFTLPDGSIAAPRSILAKQLLAAHMTPIELSAIVDFPGEANAAKLGRVVSALNDTTLAKSIDHNQQTQVTAAVRGFMTPYLNTVAPLPDAGVLAQARLDRTALVARELMATQHMSPADAARAAAADVTGGYTYTSTYRIPQAVANSTSVDANGIHNGVQQVTQGASRMLAVLTGTNGSNLYAPATNPGAPDNQRALYAAQVQHSGRWVTTPDDTGLALMVPHPDGTWDQVADRYGRPVRAGWSDLQNYAMGEGQLPFQTPPANAATNADGTAVPAFSKAAAMSAISWAVNGRESHFQSGQVSPKGARGQMQVTDDTVRTYAPRLGLPIDFDRAQNDDDYNRKIGNAALADHVNHYGATPAGLVLSLAAYNAGPGKVEGYTDQAGYHPGYLQTIGDPRQGKTSLTSWVGKLPKDVHDYINAVLPAALGKLQGH